MHRFLVFAFCVPISACALIPKEDIPTQPPTQAETTTLTVADLLPPPAPIECVNMVQLPALAEQPQPKKDRRDSGRETMKVLPVQASSPAEIVMQAQKDALVQPDSKTYFGKTSIARYIWQPGQIFTVLLAPKQQTTIKLPFKEILMIGLVLSPDDFVVKNDKVGKDETARYAVSITPQPETKGEYNVSLLTDIDHEYRLKLVVGKVGMETVIFTIPTIHEADK